LSLHIVFLFLFFFFQAEDGIRDLIVTGVQTCALPISAGNDPSTCTADALVQGDAGDAHPFCPCCLLTRSLEAFRELIEDDGFYGLRLYAMRDEQGIPQADCRVNGDDWEKGAQALRDYVKTL